MFGNACRICHGVLPDFIDGKLDDATMARLQEHLARSPRCAEEAARLQQVFTHGLRRPAPDGMIPDPGQFLSGINERIDGIHPRTAPSSVPSPGSRGDRRAIWWKPAVRYPALAAILVIVLAGGYVLDVFQAAPSPALDSRRLLTEEDLAGFHGDLVLWDALDGLAITASPRVDALSEFDAFDPSALQTLGTEIDTDLLDHLSTTELLSDGFEYVSPFDVVDDIETEDFESVLESLEQHRFIEL